MLNLDQITIFPDAPHIVKTLTEYRPSTYNGSFQSRLNIEENLEELKKQKSRLGLFSVSGRELAFCRMLRGKFLSTSIDIIEKLGSASSERFKRIQDIRERGVTEAALEYHDQAKSKSNAPGIASPIVSPPTKVPGSNVPIHSFMSHSEGEMELPPLPPVTLSGERICYICKSSIKDVEDESQWRSVVTIWGSISILYY